MRTQSEFAQPAERKPPSIARRSKRRMARQQGRGVQLEMVSQFEVRGVDSDADIAASYETQRPSVVSVLLDELFQRSRSMERRLAALDRFLHAVEGRRAA